MYLYDIRDYSTHHKELCALTVLFVGERLLVPRQRPLSALLLLLAHVRGEAQVLHCLRLFVSKERIREHDPRLP